VRTIREAAQVVWAGMTAALRNCNVDGTEVLGDMFRNNQADYIVKYLKNIAMKLQIVSRVISPEIQRRRVEVAVALH
jgi:hypothetical protein